MGKHINNTKQGFKEIRVMMRGELADLFHAEAERANRNITGQLTTIFEERYQPQPKEPTDE